MSGDRRTARAAVWGLIALVCGQGASAHPDDPQFWTWDTPQGTATSPQFIEKIKIDMETGGGSGKSGAAA